VLQRRARFITTHGFAVQLLAETHERLRWKLPCIETGIDAVGSSSTAHAVRLCQLASSPFAAVCVRDDIVDTGLIVHALLQRNTQIREHGLPSRRRCQAGAEDEPALLLRTPCWVREVCSPVFFSAAAR